MVAPQTFDTSKLYRDVPKMPTALATAMERYASLHRGLENQHLNSRGKLAMTAAECEAATRVLELAVLWAQSQGGGR